MLLFFDEMIYSVKMQKKSETINMKTGSLAGQLLVATPLVQESCFARSVIYLCAHNEAGAMGIIINYPVDTIKIDEVFEQLDINPQPGAEGLPVHFGGPVEANRGFVVHADDYESDENIIKKNGVAVSASLSILQDMARGDGPTQGMLVLGYAGWSAHQLESEIETGSWIVIPATKQLVFDTENEFKWNMALSSLGIDLGHYSNDIGHA
jgi:putative transcriptional regulator